jgi:ATP-binding cassette, subfamily B, bacterial MsbA
VQSDWQLYKRLLSYMVPFIGALVLSIFGNIMFACMEVLAADTMQLIVDSFQHTSDSEPFIKSKGLILTLLKPFLGVDFNLGIWIPIIIILIALIRGIGNFLGKYYIQVTGRNTIHSLRSNLFKHLMTQPISFYDKNTQAFLINRITYNVEQITETVTQALMILTREGLTALGLISYMVYQSWSLTLTFLLTFPIIALIVKFVSKRFRRISTRIQKSMGDVTHVSNEAISNIRVIKTFDAEDHERDRFINASQYNLTQSLKMAATDAAASPIMHLLVASALAIIIYFGLNNNISNELSSGTFVAFLTAAGLLSKPLRQLSNVLNIIQKGLAAAEDLFTQLDLKPETDDGEYSTQMLNGKIDIQHLFFSYHPDTLILDDINLTINQGETVALVGRSGSGKSTLANLLLRFYNYERGEILLDGVGLNQYRLDNLRSHFAYVNQTVTLFNDTLYNNIAYGSLKDKTEQEVREAIKIAHVDEFLDQLPQGLDTIIGDQGALLSGGQRQRISIARAILKDAPILILDEATSALDNDSERYIQDALTSVMKNRTCLVVAHRLSTIENADNIIVLDQGRIIEQGNHKSLLEQSGVYSDLYHNQFNDD